MTQLLVSVRSASEAAAALRGGAAVIDVKEPAQGSLGRASDGVIEDVVRVVAGRLPVSAAMGEFVDTFADTLPTCLNSLSYLKWGLSRYENWEEDIWQNELAILIHHLADRQPTARVVAVAYADWQRARAPKPEVVWDFAALNPVGAFLIDTWQKDGSTLLDWLSLDEIEQLRANCRRDGVPMVLAGSLGPAEVRTLLPLRPAWFAVRGAVCQGRRREATIDEDVVRQLAALLR
jgi:(5-formylfuran-3-yl)methyl phosphate synthase